MKQEDKRLLLKDLCARLPYRVKGLALGGKIDSIKTLIPTEYPWVKTSSGLSCHLGNGQFKPYLRPMSSMTEEEKSRQKDYIYHFSKNSLPDYEGDFVFETEVHEYIDWLNKHHFDYRGLIPKGLALEAPEGMYK